MTETQFGRRMRHERERRGLRQEDLANLIRQGGMKIHVSTISKMESGMRMIRLSEAAAIAKALKVTLDEMTTVPPASTAGVDVALWYLGRTRPRTEVTA